jgi:hypothetical protein
MLLDVATLQDRPTVCLPCTLYPVAVSVMPGIGVGVAVGVGVGGGSATPMLKNMSPGRGRSAGSRTPGLRGAFFSLAVIPQMQFRARTRHAATADDHGEEVAKNLFGRIHA